MKSPRFLAMLRQREKVLRHLKRKEIFIFNVRGNYGDYQITIGSEDERHHTRPIEINGHIHHLFVTKKRVGPLPSHEEVNNNLRGTIIMNDVTVHLFDENGDGHAVHIRAKDDGAHARENINLAGQEGEELLSKIEATGQLANETYHIVQEDILKSINPKL